MKAKTIKQIVYILLLIAGTLIVSHMEYEGIEEDMQAQADCRAQDTE